MDGLERCGYHRGNGCYLKNPKYSFHDCFGEANCPYSCKFFAANQCTHTEVKAFPKQFQKCVLIAERAKTCQRRIRWIDEQKSN